ncbi:hypothetical protein ONE63_007081 [Megalurothrips usitatus]|uniref:Poly(A) RNA polymerase mitochondrial-like central palm domain-containing protein n=1 Tax=Megalurothrips usitatus TaxID=439358 RepID=A0AAV7XXV3_9NEOP|nr:hypothetical protein ONE63_007081 [Megalurothrips usitatus]
MIVGSPNTRNNQNLGNNSWRKPSNTYSPTGLLNSVRNKFHDGSVLSAVERKIIAQPAALMQMLGSKTSLYETMNELHSITLKVQVDDFEREEQACEHVKQEMLSQYPNCSVALYGIRQLGMAHPKSAIYMFFNTGINYCQASNENKENQTRVRGTVYEVMKHCGHCEKVTNWDVQELVTFKHNDTEMNCVVSFTNGFKEQNTLLLKSYLKMDKRLRLLMLLVTDMVYRYHDISKYFTSYVLNIMVIMFLQRIPEPVLPTLFELRNMFPYKKVIIGGFDCGFPKETPCLQSSNHLSVENLLKGFCAFYKDFNFEDDVVSILGPELKRSMFCPPYNNTISDEPLNSYLLSLKNGGNTPKMNCDLPVIVQDPFELCCNAAEKVNMSVLEVFKMMCQDGFDILSKWC